MVETRTKRRLAAIMIADVVGYSRLIEADEAGTLAALKERRKTILEPVVKQHGGRIVRVKGDGALVEFASAVNAVASAVEIQERMANAAAGARVDRRILLRIGINMGDVVVEDGDVYGDGVNIATRLEALSQPGGICISAKVYDEVRGKIDAGFEDIGEQRLKNITSPVRAYALRSGPMDKEHRPAPALPNMPSIAVLAFENLSADPEQEYFAVGIVEEIITALSRMKWLFVIARNSSFAYKGRIVDVKQIGRELGVRYVLEGSIRKAGGRMRITGQLVETSSGLHLWADRFEGNLEDVFELQDRFTASVISAIAPKLKQAEIDRAKRKPTGSLDAYDHYLRGLACENLWTKEANDEALRHFYRAIELDPDFASAYGLAARCHTQRKVAGWMVNPVRERREAEWVARRASELGKDDARLMTASGIALAYVVGALDEGDALMDRAVSLNPNLARAWLFSGCVKLWRGETEEGIRRVERCLGLRPDDRQKFMVQCALAFAYLFTGRQAEALAAAAAAMRDNPNALLSASTAASIGAQLGDSALAANALARLQQLHPGVSVASLKDWHPFQRLEDCAKWVSGLRQAGLLE